MYSSDYSFGNSSHAFHSNENLLFMDIPGQTVAFAGNVMGNSIKTVVLLAV